MNPPPLDYRSAPQTQGNRQSIFSVGAFVTLMTIAVIVMAASITARRFEATFKDFHTDLPTATILLLGFSRVMLNAFGWIPLLAGVIGIPFLWPLVVPPPADESTARNRRRWMRLFIFIIIGLMVGFVVLALFAPMISLIQTVSSPKH
jgi:type II secretory pathway component PulF